jgi:hypothetical protein
MQWRNYADYESISLSLYIKNTIPVIPHLPYFDRFLVISFFNEKRGVDVGEEIYLIR